MKTIELTTQEIVNIDGGNDPTCVTAAPNDGKCVFCDAWDAIQRISIF